MASGVREGGEREVGRDGRGREGGMGEGGREGWEREGERKLAAGCLYRWPRMHGWRSIGRGNSLAQK
jgi:hypothetical protein